MISGFVMANKGEKISKSKGNSKVEPLVLIDQYSADVIRLLGRFRAFRYRYCI